jgi:hypothetical protein
VIVATARNTPLAPGSAAARAASEVLAARLAHALASVRSASVPSGTPEAIAARFAATEDTLAALDDDAALAFRMAGGAASIDALVLDGEAHETVASIEERAGSGVVATRSRMTNVAHVRAQIARIRRAAASVRPRDAATADRLEAAATRLQEALDTSNATFRDRAQAAMDARAREQRLAAVRAYVVAVRAAAIGHLAGSGVTRAREHLRDDANAELLREALAGVPREVARAIGLRANDPSLAFDTGAAVVTETALTAGAALAP